MLNTSAILYHVAIWKDIGFDMITFNPIPTLEIYLVGDGLVREGDSGVNYVIIECVGDKWMVVVHGTEASGWLWGELVSVMFGHGVNYAFFHPEVFHSFMQHVYNVQLDEFALVR